MTKLTLKLTAVGNSEGFILPKEARERLGITKGDVVYLTEGPDKSYRLTAHNPDVVAAMEAFDYVSKKSRNVLKALSKL